MKSTSTNALAIPVSTEAYATTIWLRIPANVYQDILESTVRLTLMSAPAIRARTVERASIT